MGPLQCTRCLSPLTNTHILGGCKHTGKLRNSRHHSTFKLLQKHLQESNGGRWPIISADLGTQPIMNFDNPPTLYDSTTYEDPNLEGITQPQDEGLHDDKIQHIQSTIPEYILPAQYRPQHHVPDIVRAIGFYVDADGRLTIDKTYKGKRQLQII